MAHQSFSKKVLEAVEKEAGARGGEIDTTELSHVLFIQTGHDHKRMLSTLSDLARTSKIVRVRQGVYSAVSKKPAPDQREVMWRTMRMRKVVTLADLQEFAGVSKYYAKEWLQMLVKRGIAMRQGPADKCAPHSWRLIKFDQVEMPVDTEKAERLRKIRAKKKQAIEKRLDTIDVAVTDIRANLNDLDKE